MWGVWGGAVVLDPPPGLPPARGEEKEGWPLPAKGGGGEAGVMLRPVQVDLFAFI